MEDYAVGCCRGLESCTELELSSLGLSILKRKEGLIIFRGPDDMNQFASLIRTAEWLSPLARVNYMKGHDVSSSAKNTPVLSAGRNAFIRASELNGQTVLTDLWKRDYRRFNHPSAIMPSTAASLLLLTRMDEDLIDPFVGGGTVVMEDRLYVKNSSRYPGLGIKDHKTTGVDINNHHLSGAKKNAKLAGVDSELALVLQDSTRYFPPERFKRMVTNPPYGVRGAKKLRILGLYKRFVDHLEGLLSHPAEGVVITTEWREMSQLLEERGYRLDQSIRIRHGKLWVGLVRFWL